MIKLTIEISEEELKMAMIDKLSDACLRDIVGWGDGAEKARKDILNKIDWKKSAPELQNQVIRKFFTKITERME